MRRRRRRRSVGKARPLTVALLMAPWAIGFFAFLLYPMVASLYFSFTRYDNLGVPQWAGLLNYRFMFAEDPFFWKAVGNTVWMILVGLPVKITASILTAMLLVRPRRGMRGYRTAVYLPSMWPPVAAALGFAFLMSPEFGPVNQLLHGIGLADPPAWFFDARWSKPALVILALWGVGDAMIIYVAGLLDVPRQLYEAAEIEGAGGWNKFRHVTLPLISPVIFFSVVTGVIDTFQYFTEAYVAAGVSSGGNAAAQALGSPYQSLLFYTSWLYAQGFRYFHMGYASALAWVLFGITMVCTLIIIKTSNRWVHYQGGGMFR